MEDFFVLKLSIFQMIFEEILGGRKVILNRPKKLNSINYEMVCCVNDMQNPKSILVCIAYLYHMISATTNVRETESVRE